MTDEQVQRLNDLADEILARPVTREDAIRKFKEMGWIGEDEKFLPQWKNLELALALDLGKDRYK